MLGAWAMPIPPSIPLKEGGVRSAMRKLCSTAALRNTGASRPPPKQHNEGWFRPPTNASDLAVVHFLDLPPVVIFSISSITFISSTCRCKPTGARAVTQAASCTSPPTKQPHARLSQVCTHQRLAGHWLCSCTPHTLPPSCTALGRPRLVGRAGRLEQLLGLLPRILGQQLTYLQIKANATWCTQGKAIWRIQHCSAKLNTQAQVAGEASGPTGPRHSHPQTSVADSPCACWLEWCGTPGTLHSSLQTCLAADVGYVCGARLGLGRPAADT